MTREYTDTCKPISSQELLELLKSHDHEAAVDVTNKRREVISKKELAALLDRSHLVEQWKGKTTNRLCANCSSPV